MQSDSGRRAITAGDTLAAGDEVETGPDGKVRLRLVDASVLAIGNGTRIGLVELTQDDERRGRLSLATGRFWMHVTAWIGSGASLVEVATPTAVAGVRGTTLWGDTDVDAICALEGTIEVRSLVAPTVPPVTLGAGSCASRLSRGELAPLAPGAEEVERYLREVLIDD